MIGLRFRDKMPPSTKRLLVALVDIALRDQVPSVLCTEIHSHDQNTSNFEIRSRSEESRGADVSSPNSENTSELTNREIPNEATDKIGFVNKIPGQVFGALQQLDLIRSTQLESGRFLVTGETQRDYLAFLMPTAY